MKMYNVSLLEFWKIGDVSATVSDIYLEQVFTLQVQMKPDTKELP